MGADPNDTSCDVCGGSTDRLPTVTLGVHGVWIGPQDQSKGYTVTPDLPMSEYGDDWEEMPPSCFLHLSCVSNYFEGLHASLRSHVRSERK